MPIDYQLATSLVRVKAATAPGTFADDDNVFDLNVALTSELLANLAWQLQGRSAFLRLKVKVTFRKNDGTEVAGTFKARGFVVVPVHLTEAELAEEVRPAVEDHGEITSASGVHMVFEEIGPSDRFGIRFRDIVATDATKMFVRVEEVL